MTIHENVGLNLLAQQAGVSVSEISKTIVDYFIGKGYLYSDDYGVTVEQIIHEECLRPFDLCIDICDKFTQSSMSHIRTLMFVADGLYCKECGHGLNEPCDEFSGYNEIPSTYYRIGERNYYSAVYVCPNCNTQTTTDGSELN